MPRLLASPFFISRRSLILAAMFVLLFTATSASAATIKFDAVAAGDVTSTDVILWTRCTDSAAPSSGVQISLDVALDSGFNTISKTANGTTDPNEDFTIKFNVTGLTAGTKYWYRFRDFGSVVFSNVGTFKTAPLN